MRTRLSKLPFSNLPFSFSPKRAGKGVARVALQGAVSNHPSQITINSSPGLGEDQKSFCFALFLLGLCFAPKIREKQRGVKNSREGTTYHNTPSQKGFWSPPTYDAFSAPVCFRPVVFCRGNRHRSGKNPTFWGLQNWFWRARSMVRFPPQKSHDTFCPPISRFPSKNKERKDGQRTLRYLKRN